MNHLLLEKSPADPRIPQLRILQFEPPRQCNLCEKWKPLSQFAKDSHRPSGRRNMCSACRKAYDWERNFIRRSRLYGLWAGAERITKAQFVDRYGDHCFYCDTKPFDTIDHWICVRAGGSHTLDNVVPCCRKCNQIKRCEIDLPLIQALRRLPHRAIAA